MKRYVAMLLSAAMLLMFAACGSSTAQPEEPVSSAEAPEVQESTETLVTPTPEPSSDSIDMLYYEDMGDGDLMAACYTDEGIARLGEDYYIIHAGEADIYNASGEKISLEELVRGCPIRITWSGAVTMSIPGQIGAWRIDALSDEADPSVPAEGEMGAIGNGGLGIVVEVPTGAPNLIVGYRNELAAASVFIPYRTGSWSWAQESGSEIAAGGSAPMLDGQMPWDWTYDDNNTIKRDGFDTVTLDFSPAADTVTVVAYAFDGTDADVELLEVELVDGVLTLLEGDHIYVVNASWNTDSYSGEATYGFLVTEG